MEKLIKAQFYDESEGFQKLKEVYSSKFEEGYRFQTNCSIENLEEYKKNMN